MSGINLSECKKIGIMGGTFNPIHIGHLLMAQWAQEYVGLNAVLFIPTGNPYMKTGTEILSGSERLKMVELSISKNEDFFVSDIEIRRNGNTYTYETVQEFHRLYPDTEFYFIAGADCLYSFEHWRHPELILKNCVLLAAARNGSGMDELESKRCELVERFGGKIVLMEFPTIEISSTLLRERIKSGKSIRHLAVDEVCDYIETNRLYL